MINRFFRALGGDPKDGDVVRCIKSFIVVPQVIACATAIYVGFKHYNQHPILCLALAYISAFFAWQAGWGMSIERFINIEKDNE